MKGSITVFLSLILAICIALICTTLESARLKGLITQLDLAADSAIDSLFASYDRMMLEQYGLLFLDGGFGRQSFSEEQITAEIEGYIKYELQPASELLFSGITLYPMRAEEIHIFNIVKAVNYGGSMFAQSVADYMKYRQVGNIADKIVGWVDILDMDGVGLEQIEDAKDCIKNPSALAGKQTEIASQSEMRKGGDIDSNRNNKILVFGNMPQYSAQSAIQLNEVDFAEERPGEEGDPGGETEADFDQERYEEEIQKSVIYEAEELKKGGFLKLVVPTQTPVSAAKISEENLPSIKNTESLSLTNKNMAEAIGRDVLYNEYLLQHFCCFMTEKERNGPQYELEYILFGKNSDEENLKMAVNRLLWIREAMNIAHILSSPEKMEAALAMASALAGWTLIPPLVTAVQLVIAGAWAYGEALLDVRSLLEGKKVSLVKNEDNWRLGISGLMDLLKGNMIETPEDSNGMSYEDYLRVLFLIQDHSEKYYRTMDMIQINMQKVKPEFLMKNCIYALEASVLVKADALFLALPITANTTGKSLRSYELITVIGRNY